MSKVLIIEDDTLISRMYKHVFEFEKFEVVVANNGVEGIEAAKNEKPDIIFCDIMMPKMNGLEVLNNLKSDPKTKSIMVIMLTNMSGTQDSQKAMDQGAHAYIIKSEFKPKEVVKKAQEFLASAKKTSSPPAAKEEKPKATTPTPEVKKEEKETSEKSKAEKQKVIKKEPEKKPTPVPEVKNEEKETSKGPIIKETITIT